ncbi:hypothetical protein FRC17_002854 [Serendipita sp. 399]|nr:hypothetical protein FRC17_002854 [Serendipita sp. 399]
MAYRSTKRYEGEENIILSFDIGTTHSAVSFTYAYPGNFPEVCSVIKWPGQPEASGDSKISTIIAYQGGEAKYFGAEARDYLDDEEYQIAHWFKLRLHPESMRLEQSYGLNKLETPELPLGVSLLQVYADFIRYIYGMTKEFFTTNTPNGRHIWSRVEDRISIVFCTPNGWDMFENAFIKDAAIKAGIVDPNTARRRLRFVTEGEASVHFALAHTRTMDWLRPGILFAVMDAGGSTVDTTLYECQSKTPLVLKEACASACVQAGGVFIDCALRDLLEHKLNGSEYCDPESIALMTKRIFDRSQTSNVIHFGTHKDNDKEYGIMRGKLALTHDEVESTFLEHLLLVGGFGESPYLRIQLKRIFVQRGTEVVTIEEPTSGAVIWHLTELVDSRAARFDYGIHAGVPYDKRLHGQDQSKCHLDLAGTKIVYIFHVIIPKGTSLNSSWRKALSQSTLYTSQPSTATLGNIKDKLCAWQGKGPTPHVLEPDGTRPPGLVPILFFSANLGQLFQTVQCHYNFETRRAYWKLYFWIEFKFIEMQLSARLMWMDEGTEYFGPATVMPASKL